MYYCSPYAINYYLLIQPFLLYHTLEFREYLLTRDLKQIQNDETRELHMLVRFLEFHNLITISYMLLLILVILYMMVIHDLVLLLLAEVDRRHAMTVLVPFPEEEL